MSFHKVIVFGFLFVVPTVCCPAQNEFLQKDVSFLSDSLENRYPSSVGDHAAREYISNHFSDSGLSCSTQPFDIVEYIWGEGSLSIHKGDSVYVLSAGKDFSVAGRSATDSLFSEYVIVSGALPDSLYKTVQGKVIINTQNKADNNAGSRITSISDAVNAGASAIIYVSPKGQRLSNGPSKGNRFHHTHPIPVLFLDYNCLPVFTEPFSTLNKVQISTTHHDRRLIAANIIGEKNGTGSNYLVIGAHYDTCGPDSLDGDRKPGANDNASGVAALMALARFFSKTETRHNLLFVAFGGEEKGLLGSEYFVSHLSIDAAMIDEMINLDMLGSMKHDTLYYRQVNSVLIEPSELRYDSLVLKSDRGPTSDYLSFANAGIATTHFYTGEDTTIHTSADTSDRLNYDGMARIVDYLIHYILTIDKTPQSGQDQWL